MKREIPYWCLVSMILTIVMFNVSCGSGRSGEILKSA